MVATFRVGTNHMIDSINALLIGQAHRELQLHTITLGGTRFSDLHNALGEVRDKTSVVLADVLNAINMIAEDQQRGDSPLHVDDLKLFEVNTHNIMAMKTRRYLDVQIIVSVLRVK